MTRRTGCRPSQAWRVAAFPHGLAVTTLCLAAVAYCWPLISRVTTAVPSLPWDDDAAMMVWNVGTVKHALDGAGSLLWTDMILVPFGADLRLHLYGLLQGLVAYPLIPVLGVVGAFNVVVIATVVLNGVSGYALIYSRVRHPLAATAAAACLMLGSSFL